MKSTIRSFLVVAVLAVFAAGCGKNAASADDVAALRKEVAELRAEVQKLSRSSRHARQMRGEAMPDRAERRTVPPRSASVAKDGSDATKRNYERVNLTPEQRKARIEELRKRHVERKNASKERRAQRRAARASAAEGQGTANPAPTSEPPTDAPQADSVQ